MSTQIQPRPALKPLLAGAFLIAALLTGCSRAADPQTVETYDVPPAHADAIATAINSTLMQSGDRTWLGRAHVAAPSVLVVRAPESMQASIEESIGRLRGGKDVVAPAAQLRVELWWITESADGTALPATLSAVAESVGRPASALRVRDRVQLASASGTEPAVTEGKWLSLSYRAVAEGEAYSLTMKIRQQVPDAISPEVIANGGMVAPPLRYDGSIRIAPGKFLVLASRPNGGGEDYLVVRLSAE